MTKENKTRDTNIITVTRISAEVGVAHTKLPGDGNYIPLRSSTYITSSSTYYNFATSLPMLSTIFANIAVYLDADHKIKRVYLLARRTTRATNDDL